MRLGRLLMSLFGAAVFASGAFASSKGMPPKPTPGEVRDIHLADETDQNLHTASISPKHRSRSKVTANGAANGAANGDSQTQAEPAASSAR